MPRLWGLWVASAMAFDESHREEMPALAETELMNRDDVGMVERSRASQPNPNAVPGRAPWQQLFSNPNPRIPTSTARRSCLSQGWSLDP